ncbi:putative glycosyl hydrolase [Enterococcus sp. PF1-24]|uniref:glycoside hydrolase family 65 protein n=1 Tax=unclassified Enterococcus TaxID=2608891 RepID=UPI002473162E|nr:MULTISPECIES: glycosyl hydrolase family 65 protein [unclassified Enterococcus]MDH6365319.1 putative glycosyl hydrolase [Enterococcus sp. PFB1-1]MDH6402425.1 putative glycosyl hydrolase [Enterococcus sp. PF1-24]
MRTGMKYFENNPWLLGEDHFETDWLGKAEAAMYLGNGYMGIRSATEESYVGEKRDTFVAGTFNKFDANEVTELPNVPDMIGMEIRLNQQRLDLTKGIVTNYQRNLDLKTGELLRSFVWEYQEIKAAFTFKRFVSFEQKHLLGQQIEIKNLGANIELEIVSGIDGQVSNSGSQHFTEGDKALAEGKYMQMMPYTSQSNIFFVLSTVHKIAKERDIYEETKKRIEMGRRKIYNRYWLDLAENQTVTIEKISSIHTSIDKETASKTLEEVKEIALTELKEATETGYQKLFEASKAAWDKKVWSVLPISIESKKFKDQLALNFAKYHLHIMTPAHDERMNIAAKGLSGEGYKGHTFWDTEIFMLPYFTFTHPEIAKSLVTYRYLGLEGAHKKAQINGYEGAQFPWEAAWPDDGETTPVWGAADIITGKPTKIWSGFIEQHITSDVAFGIKQYLDVTGDQEFAKEKGYEVILDTAKFWASRLEWQEDKQRYEILEVVGPDEYKEHVDNNSFTNYTAHWNITLAINLYERLQQEEPELFEKLNQKLALERVYAEWQDKVDKIYLPQPNQEGVLPQDDKYLSKKIIDLTEYKNSPHVGTLFHDYNLEQVNDMQVTKQADVLLLLFLFENLFPKKEKLINWNYYEPKTLHDSSLSLSTHAILAADLGKLDLSYDLFNQAMNIDMGENMTSSNEGIHAASIGGIWQMTVLGYGGVRCLNGKLRIEPHLPEAWSKLSFGIVWQGNPLEIQVTKEQFSVRNLGVQEVSFEAFGNNYSVSTEETIIF